MIFWARTPVRISDAIGIGNRPVELRKGEPNMVSATTGAMPQFFEGQCFCHAFFERDGFFILAGAPPDMRMGE